MKFLKRKLTKTQLKNRKDAYREIEEVLIKYPIDTPILIISGQHIIMEETVDLSDISCWRITGCVWRRNKVRFVLPTKKRIKLDGNLLQNN